MRNTSKYSNLSNLTIFFPVKAAWFVLITSMSQNQFSNHIKYPKPFEHIPQNTEVSLTNIYVLNLYWKTHICCYNISKSIFDSQLTSWVILTPAPSQVFDWQEERPLAEGQSDEGWNQVKERGRIQSDEWVKATATRVQEVDVEPFDYDLDISREVDKQNCLANYLCLKFMLVFFFFFFLQGFNFSWKGSAVL